MGSNGLATSIEMFRKGTSFTDWSDRLAYTFHANQVAADRQKSHFMTICGPFLFSQLKLHYGKDELDKATYADIVLKLKQKLDKTEPDLVQRFRFSQRNQQPDESNEDFVQAVKMQAEFCGFGAFKDVAIMDRVLAGLLDGNLKENLLKEEGLTLDKMDKFITTWNIAKQNVKALNNQPGESQLGQYNYFTPEQIHYIQKTTTQRQGSSREDKKARWRLVARTVVLWTRRRCAVRGDWQSKRLLVECSKRNDLLLKTKCETTWRFRTRTRVVLDAADTVRLGVSLNGKEQNAGALSQDSTSESIMKAEGVKEVLDYGK
ncbi:conserved hypothetical protein [Culex quinquefasciatus]|uniref:Uncharacterized protein n=1 Tax=Culex quinquefasciatus TaxID=7176 RepID=B0WZY3_CULQU|nr:conserved hypothetical protein [Culex quinquefasciatus]|eukprot:XP_001862955.1 conserved hypothetical protein [Culex quinquefasciatus]